MNVSSSDFKILQKNEMMSQSYEICQQLMIPYMEAMVKI
jgi:hypothetical protein